MMMRTLAISATLVIGAASAFGQNSKGPVDVEANSMEIIEANKQAIFKGGVVAARQGETMKADQMVVNYAEAKGGDANAGTEVQDLDATGNVVITTKTQTITGDWAKMDVPANKLQVGGNVRVVQGKTVLVGQKLNVDLDTNRTLMTGGRVRGQFVPR
jgi:lipopolysaccharide export system protein LptA